MTLSGSGFGNLYDVQCKFGKRTSLICFGAEQCKPGSLDAASPFLSSTLNGGGINSNHSSFDYGGGCGLLDRLLYCGMLGSTSRLNLSLIMGGVNDNGTCLYDANHTPFSITIKAPTRGVGDVQISLTFGTFCKLLRNLVAHSKWPHSPSLEAGVMAIMVISDFICTIFNFYLYIEPGGSAPTTVSVACMTTFGLPSMEAREENLGVMAMCEAKEALQVYGHAGTGGGGVTTPIPEEAI